MRIRTVSLALAAVFAIAAGARAEALDLKRYMPFSEVQPGMTGVGKTTLEGTAIVEFQIKVMACVKNSGPKRNLIIVRLSGAGLEQSGTVAGMSGSPVYIDGRLIGAVAYAFPWCKVPLAGIQPIEQMLRLTDRPPWVRSRPVEISGALASAPESPRQDLFSVPVAALGLPDVPAALAGRESCDMQPIRTPVMVSGFSGRAMERLRESLAPFGMMPMQGGAADAKTAAEARLEPGAPLAITMVRGDIQMTTMGTITEIAGDRLYAFGHAMLGAGDIDLPMMTGVAYVVVPSLMNSVRLGAAAREVGRLTWDEETGVLGAVGAGRAAMVPVTIRQSGPGKGHERIYRCEMVHNRILSPRLVAAVTGNALTAETELPLDHTITYRVTVKPVGRDPVVRDNVAVSPNGDAYLEGQVRAVVGLLMENPFNLMKVESVEVQATVEVGSRLAEIEEARPLRNAVRPGDTVPIELKIRPWRAEPAWTTVEVKVPADFPEGTCRLYLCGADEALRQEQREVPVRFRPDDVDSLLATMQRGERRDQLFIRIEAPGAGLAIGQQELPNLPPTMRAVLADSARRQVTGVTGALVTKQASPYILSGSRTVEIAVSRKAPEK
jgi:hypothetical protein